MKYLVTITQTVEVEADDIDEAEMLAAGMIDCGEAYYETEEVAEDA